MVSVPSAYGAKWSMRVQQNTLPYPEIISLYINGVLLGDGDLNEGLANINGNYSGRPVQAICHAPSNEGANPSGMCVVYVDGTQVATLLF
jgi:hypothetical protein